MLELGNSWQGQNLVSVGTHLKYYIERGGAYFDITPIRSTVTLTDPFDTTDGSAVVLVTDTAHGALEGDFVTFSGATAVGGLDLNGEYQISLIDEDSYNITAETTASSTATGGGTVTAAYQINIGSKSKYLSRVGVRALGVWVIGVSGQLQMNPCDYGVKLTSVKICFLRTEAVAVLLGCNQRGNYSCGLCVFACWCVRRSYYS
jgi:hypothetical protein